MFLYGLAQSVDCECFECFFTPPHLVVCGVESINLYILLAQTWMWLLRRLITIITHYGHVITLKTSHWRICQTIWDGADGSRGDPCIGQDYSSDELCIFDLRTFTNKSCSRIVLCWHLLKIKLSEEEEVRHWRQGWNKFVQAQADLEIHFPPECRNSVKVLKNKTQRQTIRYKDKQ